MDLNIYELMILSGTLGGYTLFGIFGLIIGPIIAALFVTAWNINGIAFKDVFPLVGASAINVDPYTSEVEIAADESGSI